jgi:hypothetical protein
MTDLKELEKLRPCGRLETYSTSRHHLGYYNNVAVTATYSSPSLSVTSLESLIFAALRQVIAKHPNLSVIALDEDKSYPHVYFARLPSIDLRTCVEFRNRKEPVPGDGETDEDLEQVLAEQHSRSYKDDLGTKPFWRLVVLTSPNDKSTFTATWAFHHALSDGASALLFHETFLAALNSFDPNANADSVVIPPKTLLPPAFENLHPLPISWTFFLNTLAKILLPSIFNKRPTGLWTGTPVPATLAPIFRFRTLIFPASTSTRLTQLCRSEKTSITATLQCLLAASLFTHLPSDQFSKLQISVPIAMRRFLDNVPADQMTNALTQYEYVHHRAATPGKSDILCYFSWDETRAVKAAIASELAKCGSDNPIALLRYVSDIHEYIQGHLGKERLPSVEVSNIGVVGAKKEDGNWEMGRVTFSQCPNPTSAAVCVNVVTGASGEMSVNFCWGERVVEGEFIGSVVEGVKKGVEELVGGV